MRARFAFSIVLAVGAAAACSSAKPTPAATAATAKKAAVVADADAGPPAAPDPIATDELEPLLRTDSDLAALIDDAPRRRLQVLAAFPTKKDGKMTLHRSGLRLDAEYFYPASAVKIYAAYGAIQKVDDLTDDLNTTVSLTTPIRFTFGEGRATKTTKTTLKRDLEQALIVSDNDAYDRLFDFVGREELAERLGKMGLKHTILVQHLGRLGKSHETTPPLIDLLVPPPDPPVPVSHRFGFEVPSAPWAAVKLGRAYIDDHGKKVLGPMDFSMKNATTLGDLQDALIAIARPELYDRLPDGGTLPYPTARQDMLDILAKLPSQLEGTWRGHPTAKDAFHKPLAIALQAAFPEEKVRVYQKCGRAYGFAVDNAYVVSERTGRGFFLTSTVYANDNDTLNDDTYEYQSVNSPFLARVGVILARKVFRDPEPK